MIRPASSSITESAAHGHSTGDHASAQGLARKALGHSVDALEHAEEVAKRASQSIQD